MSLAIHAPERMQPRDTPEARRMALAGVPEQRPYLDDACRCRDCDAPLRTTVEYLAPRGYLFRLVCDTPGCGYRRAL